ncbi:hypothetical protein RSOLAG1IB_09525 [Rhizoctonia solani AG-1 IB]|uniref:Uncharacterized protein n=1 Tax=Thanatephorus cucumeris (strain AG1-IB / isolate 7/3/14) TaxID=1108050 RepID=A0A0B7FQL7_THACB|nr:hypothetical protein RSOLAG1IB_09525 [Rhizoctonia solani AG-1 IB]
MAEPLVLMIEVKFFHAPAGDVTVHMSGELRDPFSRVVPTLTLPASSVPISALSRVKNDKAPFVLLDSKFRVFVVVCDHSHPDTTTTTTFVIRSIRIQIAHPNLNDIDPLFFSSSPHKLWHKRLTSTLSRARPHIPWRISIYRILERDSIETNL